MPETARSVDEIAARPRPQPTGGVSTPAAAELAALFDALDPGAPLAARLDAVEDVVRWVVELPPSRRYLRPVPFQVGRLRHLVRALGDDAGARHRLSATLSAILAETSGVSLFAEAGMPSDRGLGRETLDRLSRRLLPRPPDHNSLERFLSRVFRNRRDCAWIATVPLDLVAELAALVGDVWQPVREAMADAVALVSTRASALGLGEDLRERSPACHVRESPFFKLPRASLDDLPGLIAQCRGVIAAAHQTLESQGVSVDVVYCLDTVSRMLARVESMLPLLSERGDRLDRLGAARALLGALTAARLDDDSVRQLVRANVRLLARKVIERIGHTGEHYVTATRGEYWRLMASAGGGGALTAITCVVKFFTKWGHFPLFVDGALSSLNYAASFMIMQLLGLTLATKQPSMTAAALAGTIKEVKAEGESQGQPQHRLDELVTMITRISRSQLAAAIGNVSMVIPAVLLIDVAWTAATGQHFLDAAGAHKTIQSFSPLGSGTIFFAALTGVLLWMSSIGAGWFENWIVYRRVPDGIRYHRLGKVVGADRLGRLADFLAGNAAGIGGNVTLGILLGMTPVLGTFFGLPLEVRHLTLSTGALALSVCSLGVDAMSTGGVQAACVGIVLMGILNFGISFALALAVAFRAREVGSREQLKLVGAVFARLLRHPLDFVFPPRTLRYPMSPPIPPR